MSEIVKEGEIILYITQKGKLDKALAAIGAPSLLKTPQGAPYLENSDVKVSVSHKGNVVVLACSKEPVGVDIEDVTVPRNIERLSRLFHVSEKVESLYDFYKVWTSKEAEGKRVGTGVNAEILRAKTEGAKYMDYGDYLICAIGEGDLVVRELD